jgi:hypothetical protein
MSGFLSGAGGVALGAALVVVIAVAALVAVFATRRLEGSSLFNRFFVLVAGASGFFSAVSSAIGFSLITSQETTDFLRNAVLPPAFGAFVFFLSLAVWVGGAELVRHRDWFRGMAPSLASDALFFLERALKLFIVVPLLSVILFVVSTWTTVVGLGGVDAVRYVYGGEIERLQSDCAALTQWRGRDLSIRDQMRLSSEQVARSARAEAQGGLQSGAVGEGAVAAYLKGVSDWYADLERGVSAIVAADAAPRDSAACAASTQDLRTMLARDPYANYDAWAREFQARFNDRALTLNAWRTDRRIETLLDQQLAAFDRANPKPVLASPAQRAAIDRFEKDVKDQLKALLRDLRSAKGRAPRPLPAAADAHPERGLAILVSWFEPDAAEKAPPRPRATAPLSTITPRDAVLLHADVFSDVWALGIAWDYAAYLLMLAYLFFPSAERAAGRK